MRSSKEENKIEVYSISSKSGIWDSFTIHVYRDYVIDRSLNASAEIGASFKELKKHWDKNGDYDINKEYEYEK